MNKQLLRKWPWLLLALVLVVALAWWFWPRPPKHNFLTVDVKKANIESAVLASGVLEPFQEVDVGAQVSGQVQKLNVTLGETVTKGQLLAVIDPTIKENDLQTAEASLDNVRAQKQAKEALLRQYLAQYQREQAMSRQDAAAKADLESAEANYQTTLADIAAIKAQVVQAELEVNTAKTNLGYTQITAPMNGVVTSIVTKEGQTVNANQSAPTILVLANLDTMTVKAEISEADVTKVKAGQHVYFTTLGEPDKRFEATLRSIEPYPTTISGSSSSESSSSDATDAVYYYGLFDVQNPGHELRKYMTAEVHIVQSEAKDTLSIPISQLGKSLGNNRYQVLVLQHGRPPHPQTITTGIRDNINVQVLDGLKEGDKLVVGDNAMTFSEEGRRRPRGPFGF